MSTSYLSLLEALRSSCNLPHFPDPLPSTQLDLELENGLTITLDWNEKTNFVEFFCQLGTYLKKEELEVFKKIAQANFLWTATGGATLSARPEVQTIYLAYQAPVASLQGKEFVRMVEKFVTVAQEWQKTLSGKAAAKRDE